MRFPGNVVETLGFGTDGRLTARSVGSGSVGLIDDALAYDLRDRVIAATTGYRAGATSGQTATTWYGGLGAVIAADNHGNAGGWAEGFEVDALGNRVRKQQQGMRPSWHPDYYGIRFSSYDSDGRLVAVSDTTFDCPDPYAPCPDQYRYDETYLYDAGGARTLQYSVEWDAQSNVSKQEMARSYSSVDDKLRVFERNAKGGAGEPGERPVSEEYRYDALGRRVLTRSRRLPGCDPVYLGIECASVIERVAWDGDQILIEARANGAEVLTTQQLEQETSSGGAYGRVVYAHASGIDQPLSVSKDGVAVMPHLNWRGQYDVGSLADGSSTSACTGTPSCPVIAWPGGARSLDQETLDPQVIQTWFGNLITDKADGSGPLYKRHRYYDPQTGQFTQQDPIGLAGGLNSYGYASSDPVTYSDPFGLCPVCDIADVGFFLYSAGKALFNPSRENLKNLGWDGLGLLPVIPSLGMVRRVGGVFGKADAVTAVIPEGKLGYLFGAASGDAHNVARAQQNLRQMSRLGASEADVVSHLQGVVNDPSNIARTFSNKHGTFEVRESLFAGRSGQFAKFQSTWRVMSDGSRQLVTVIPYGGR